MAKFKFSKKVVAVTAGALLVLILGVFVGRGWIRATLVPAYAQHFYMPSVDDNFSKNFSDVSRQLATYGLKFNTNYDECWSGDSAQFENFKETVTCIKSLESNAVSVSDNLRERWKTESPQLEQSLLESGWQKQYNAHESISELPALGYSASVNYAKNIGKTRCELSIGYAPRNSNTVRDQMWSHELCQRDVKFFGGMY